MMERYIFFGINKSDERAGGGTVYVKKIYTCMEIHQRESEAWRKQLQESEMKGKQKCFRGLHQRPHN